MIAQIVSFRSGLPDEEVLEMYKSRVPQYRKLKGLLQKYYLRFSETGEHGAVYLRESDAALRDFKESELGRTIASAYKIQGTADILMGEVVLTLHDG